MNGTNGRTFLLMLLSCGFFACGENVAEDSLAESTLLPEMTLVNGHAVFGHEVRTIRPCGEEDALWVVDSTQLLWDLHGELAPGVEPYEEVFAVVQGIARAALSDGFGADYSGSFYVDRILYAAGEGWGCDLDLSSFQFRLSGNEPFWSLVVTDSTVELNRMDTGLRIWNDVQSEPFDNRLRYFSEGEEPGAVEVTIREEPCRDSMSGAYSGYTGTVAVSGEVLIGCALRGVGG